MLPVLGVQAIFAGPSGDARHAAGLEQSLASSANLDRHLLAAHCRNSMTKPPDLQSVISTNDPALKDPTEPITPTWA
jgi:hypothetical protein